MSGVEGGVANRPRYNVLAERRDAAWLVRVPELGLATQAARRDDIEPAAREVISRSLDIPPHSFDLDIETLST